MPEVREDRVAQAKARLEAGEYDSEGVKRQIADRLLEQFGL
jgi:anti-sigma28 factor (negative regulator of flagellin synthesis)